MILMLASAKETQALSYVDFVDSVRTMLESRYPAHFIRKSSTKKTSVPVQIANSQDFRWNWFVMKLKSRQFYFLYLPILCDVM